MYRKRHREEVPLVRSGVLGFGDKWTNSLITSAGPMGQQCDQTGVWLLPLPHKFSSLCPPNCIHSSSDMSYLNVGGSCREEATVRFERISKLANYCGWKVKALRQHMRERPLTTSFGKKLTGHISVKMAGYNLGMGSNQTLLPLSQTL